MVSITMDEEEAKFLLSVLERYDMHLGVEIARTHRREFKEALKERAETLKTLIDRLKKESAPQQWSFTEQ
ncbi:MAG TPA: hypothetical protein VHO84_09270 [Syntrophorhabdaceae bacterium]|nr:hypothetical protein [Syntrophorhabdaceae bacterium]